MGDFEYHHKSFYQLRVVLRLPSAGEIPVPAVWKVVASLQHINRSTTFADVQQERS